MLRKKNVLCIVKSKNSVNELSIVHSNINEHKTFVWLKVNVFNLNIYQFVLLKL